MSIAFDIYPFSDDVTQGNFQFPLSIPTGTKNISKVTPAFILLNINMIFETICMKVCACVTTPVCYSIEVNYT